MTDLINEILATLRHNKLRTALTGFAVSWGIFLLIVLLSVSEGLLNGMESMFSQRDTESMTIEGGWTHKPYKGLTDNRQITLRERDIDIIRNRNSNVVTRITADIRNNSDNIHRQGLCDRRLPGGLSFRAQERRCNHNGG